MMLDASSPIVRVMRREFTRITERKTLSLLSIGLPIVLFVLLASIYKNALVRDLPVAVCDDDRSELSRLVIRSIESTSSMSVVLQAGSMAEMSEFIRQGKVQAGFYIPRRFESDVKGGSYSTVTVVKNTFNLIIGNMILKDAATILKTISGGVVLKKMKSKGMSDEQAMNIVSPIRLDTQVLYNPNYSYLNFLIPPLLPVVLQMVIMVAGALIISSEFTHGTFSELVEAGKGSVCAVYFGKALPHLALHSATALGILGIIFPLFGVEIAGSLALALGLLLYFTAASLALALAVSSLFQDQQKATEISVFLVTPAFAFSGLTFPLWAMPALPAWYAQTMPFTPFLNAFLKLSQMNTPIAYIVPELLHLSAFLFISMAVSMFAIRRQIRLLTAADVKKEAVA
ncbi:MAG TPA: ABC transporter permease [Bacteroidota bacterium]|nr:ABC transporter permease [Bacteroidota bacterium]